MSFQLCYLLGYTVPEYQRLLDLVKRYNAVPRNAPDAFTKAVDAAYLKSRTARCKKYNYDCKNSLNTQNRHDTAATWCEVYQKMLDAATDGLAPIVGYVGFSGAYTSRRIGHATVDNSLKSFLDVLARLYCDIDPQAKMVMHVVHECVSEEAGISDEHFYSILLHSYCYEGGLNGVAAGQSCQKVHEVDPHVWKRLGQGRAAMPHLMDNIVHELELAKHAERDLDDVTASLETVLEIQAQEYAGLKNRETEMGDLRAGEFERVLALNERLATALGTLSADIELLQGLSDAGMEVSRHCYS